MTYIPDELKQFVRQCAKYCCEYCLIPQSSKGFTHEVDHIIPEKHRGETIASNLCLSCLFCNRHKGTDFASFDPLDNQLTLLFNPREDH